MGGVFACLWVSACSGDDGSESSGNEARGSSGQAGSAGMAPCYPTACTCPNGLTGEQDCDSAECHCDSCPPFEPETPVPLQGCGGEPFGFWRLKSIDSNGFPLYVRAESGGGSHCQGQVVSLTESSADYLIEFLDGGSGNARFPAPRAEVLLANSCIQNVSGVSCENLFGYDCVKEDCGLCRCDLHGSGVDGRFGWSRSGSTLTVDMEFSSEPSLIEYCVDGSTLTLLASDGGINYVFERAYPTGVPTPCAERSVAECTSMGCHIGACDGAGDCVAAQTEASCTNQQGCSWNAAICSGEAPSSCTFSDYGFVPGCVIPS